MARYEQIDKDGNIADVFLVDEATLKADPDAVLKSRGPKKSRPPTAPDGYDFLATMNGDPDALVADCVVHVYAKHGSYEKEKPSKLSGLKALVAEVEAKKEAEGVPAK